MSDTDIFGKEINTDKEENIKMKVDNKNDAVITGTSQLIVFIEKLKKQLLKWKISALLILLLLILVSVQFLSCNSNKVGSISGSYIARIKIDDVISDDETRDSFMEKIKNDNNVKALIVEINSPGGTLTGSERLYNQIRAISKKNKPVVSVMTDMGASGGYMVAIAGDYIIAQNSTLTGSIGVIMESAEFTDLAKKVGITFNQFKSSPIKGSPTPFEKVSPAISSSINSIIKDSYNLFVQMVRERRKIKASDIDLITDGRVLTGRQAVKYNMVDQIGTQEEALDWLYKKGISNKLKIVDIDVANDEANKLRKFLSSVIPFHIKQSNQLKGILAIWQL